MSEIGCRTSLELLERAVAYDLELLNLPSPNWTHSKPSPDGGTAIDVLVVGGGMYGTAASAALNFKGIRNTRILDRSSAGREGPWLTFARMETLRSPKDLTGPCYGIPSLTFRAWYEAIHGKEKWNALYKIPKGLWAEYISWLRRILSLQISNQETVTAIEPQRNLVKVRTQSKDGEKVNWARHVVLATGRAGAGGPNIPNFMDTNLFPDLAAHTTDDIDFSKLSGKSVVVIGGGTSAWDNAATALENGATVNMYVRRATLPQINKGRGTVYPGFLIGYAALADANRWKLHSYLEDVQLPPPKEAVARALKHANFKIHLGSPVTRVRRENNQLNISLANGNSQKADFLIVGTGFRIDLRYCNELKHLSDKIATWSDRYLPPKDLNRSHLARAPYLGPGYELIERIPGECPGLSRIHLFNFGAYASLGALVSGDIPGVAFAAERLASAITADIFCEDISHVHRDLEAFAELELEGTPFFVQPEATVKQSALS